MKRLAKITGSALLLGMLGTGLATACEAPKEAENTPVAEGIGSKDAAEDVELGTMQTPYGIVEIPVTVTNNSDEQSDYWIEASVFDSNGTQVDTAATYVQRVAPGVKAKGKLVGIEMSGVNADNYKLTLVERTASSK